jgi:ABC-type branched-subunit amino acid transport system ATPase component
MHTHSSAPAIAVAGLRKSFGHQVVLDGIDLDVPPGTIFALLGPNGAGKTTAVRILSTLIRPDAGTVAVADQLGGPRPGGEPGGDLAAREQQLTAHRVVERTLGRQVGARTARPTA